MMRSGFQHQMNQEAFPGPFGPESLNSTRVTRQDQRGMLHPGPGAPGPPPDSLGIQCTWMAHLPPLSPTPQEPTSSALREQNLLLSPPLHFRLASSYVECLSDPDSQHL